MCKDHTSVHRQVANPCWVLSCELHVAALCSTASQAKLVQLPVSVWARTGVNSNETSAKMTFIVRLWKSPSCALRNQLAPRVPLRLRSRTGKRGCSALSIHTHPHPGPITHYGTASRKRPKASDSAYEHVAWLRWLRMGFLNGLK